MIYVVLGMHKSGTTLVAEILHDGLINMVDDDKEDLGYDIGHKFERMSTKIINKMLLGNSKKNSVDNTNLVQVKEISEKLLDDGKVIVLELNKKYKNWGFKDPRTVLTYDYWNEILSHHKIIFTFRCPFEVFNHYVNDKNLWVGIKGLIAWYKYNKNILNQIKNTNKEYIVLSYNHLMNDDCEFDRLQNFVGKELKDSRKENLYRNKNIRTLLVKAIELMLLVVLGINISKMYNELLQLRRINIQKNSDYYIGK